MENCDYCNYGGNSKDCYLCAVPFGSQNCMYSRGPYMCVSDNDGYANISSQYCYECISCVNGYELFFCQYSTNCSNSAFLVDCISSKNCFASVGLRHKEYVFLNQQLSKEEYEKRVTDILNSYKQLTELKKYFDQFRLKFPYKHARNRNSENCEGDLLNNCKNCKECFDLIDQQDSKYCILGGEKTHSIWDSTIIGLDSVNCYENIGSINNHNCISCIYVTSNLNCYYCVSSDNCKNCFGCDGLKRKEYCILNKQYTKEAYEELMPRIIEHMQNTGEWGEFFPAHFSPYGYNESIAEDYEPLGKEEVLKRGWNWYESAARIQSQTEYILKDNIKDEDETVIGKTLICELSGEPYKIIKQEYDFHKKYNLALPRRSPKQRLRDRIAMQEPYKLNDRSCAKCSVAIRTRYSNKSHEIIYCENCYAKHYN